MADAPAPLPPPSTPAPWWSVIGLCYLVLIIFAIALLQVIRLKEMQLLSNMIIAIIGFVGGGLGFYWGSSSSSAKKDDANTALALATTAPTSTAPSDAAKALDAKLAP